MQIKNMREQSYALAQPFAKSHLNKDSFVRCLDGNGAPGTPHMGSVYLVRDVTEVVDNERGRTSFLYKLDGFEGGIRSDKMFRANQFQRWLPCVGDVVLRGSNPNPLLVSRIDVSNSSNPIDDKIHLHSYSADRKVWSYMDSDRGQDIRPAVGIHVDTSVIETLHEATNVLNAVIPDDLFVPPTNVEVPPDEDLGLATKGDLARNVRLSNLRRDYMAALETAIYSNDQYVVQMGEPLPGGQEVRNVGERLKIVKPRIKR